MKINGNWSPGQVSGPSPLSGGGGRPAAGAPASRDSVRISARAREIETVKDVIRQMPEVREDRIAGLRERVAAGLYHVPGEDVARSILAAVFKE